MLEAILIGLLTSGIYYVAQQDRDSQKEKARITAITKETIKATLEHGFQTLFPEISKRLSERKNIDPQQIKYLQDLIFTGHQELEFEMKKYFEGELLGRFSVSECQQLDIISIQEMEKTLRKIIARKEIKGLDPELIADILPRLVVEMLFQIERHPGLKQYADVIRRVRDSRFQQMISKELILDDEKIFETIKERRRKLYLNSRDAYIKKLNGIWYGAGAKFDYVEPALSVIRRDEKFCIPSESDWEKQKEEISFDDFIELLIKEKRILLIAGAGVGKTTFMHHLHLELLCDHIEEIPLPIFEETKTFLTMNGDLTDRVTAFIQKTDVIGFDPNKSSKIANLLNAKGRLCYLLDSLDQASDTDKLNQYFNIQSSQYLGHNIVVLACRQEQIHLDPEKYRRYYHEFTWVFLGKFSDNQLKNYLGPEVVAWLNYEQLPENFQDLLQTAFYANIARCLGLRKETENGKIKKRADLLARFIDELFRQTSERGVKINPNDEEEIKNFLYQLSNDTLSKGEIQSFPVEFRSRLNIRDKQHFDKITEAQWLYRRIFEGKNEKEYVFYHQLLQEYFAACKMRQDLIADIEAFKTEMAHLPGLDGSERINALEKLQTYCSCLERMPYSVVLLDFLDEMLSDEATFCFCMDMISRALELSELKEEGLANTGHKFTWLLALRDRKGEKSKLAVKLESIFEDEMEKSQSAEIEGKFVKVPAGPFLMGGYEYDREQPVRVIYLHDYWISRYAETFDEYDNYCSKNGIEKPGDEGWGRNDRPVINVSWEDTKEYVTCLGQGHHLPTEAQWEKASRGRFGRKYPWGNAEPDNKKANLRTQKCSKIEKVTSYAPYMYCIHQMTGNVDEWCQDWFGFYQPDSVTDPINDSEASVLVVRGGGWRDYARYCRSAYRYGYGPGISRGGLGFRLART